MEYLEYPKPKTIIHYLLRSEGDEMIQKAQEEPYTFQNLFESPEAHTYRGLGKEFEEYSKELNRAGEELTLYRYVWFFKEIFGWILLNCFVCYSLEFSLPLLMESFLLWVDKDSSKMSSGYWLMTIVVLFFVVRLVTSLRAMYYSGKLFYAYTKNAIEVKIHSLILKPNI